MKTPGDWARNRRQPQTTSSGCRLWGYYKECAYWDFLKAQIGKPYDKLAIAAFAFNRDWRSPDAWFCDELVAAGLEHAEVVRRLAPCVNRLDVRDVYLIVSALAPVKG